MKRDGEPMMAVLVAVVVSLGVVALFVGFGVERTNFNSSVRQCVAAVEASNVKDDVVRDVAKGEHRFYYDKISEWDLAGDAASGIFDDTSKTCRRPEKSFREWPFHKYIRYLQTGRNERVWATDPIYSPSTDCGRAVKTYMHEYNGIMASLHPASVEKYCK